MKNIKILTKELKKWDKYTYSDHGRNPTIMNTILHIDPCTETIECITPDGEVDSFKFHGISYEVYLQLRVGDECLLGELQEHDNFKYVGGWNHRGTVTNWDKFDKEYGGNYKKDDYCPNIHSTTGICQDGKSVKVIYLGREDIEKKIEKQIGEKYPRDQISIGERFSHGKDDKAFQAVHSEEYNLYHKTDISEYYLACKTYISDSKGLGSFVYNTKKTKLVYYRGCEKLEKQERIKTVESSDEKLNNSESKELAPAVEKAVEAVKELSKEMTALSLKLGDDYYFPVQVGDECSHDACIPENKNYGKVVAVDNKNNNIYVQYNCGSIDRVSMDDISDFTFYRQKKHKTAYEKSMEFLWDVRQG